MISIIIGCIALILSLFFMATPFMIDDWKIDPDASRECAKLSSLFMLVAAICFK